MKPIESRTDLALKVIFALGMLASLVGCGVGRINTTPPKGSGPAPTPGASKVYVIQSAASFGVSEGEILQFSATASGVLAPTSTITAPTNDSFEGLATDGAGNLYTAAYSPKTLELLAYPEGVTTPTRTIPSNATTKLYAPDGITANTAGEIFVSEDTGGVATYSATATGSVAPTSYILGASETGGGLSTLIAADQVAVDSAGTLYILAEGNPVGPGPILVFSPGATGNVAPDRVIGGATTTLGGIGGLTTDSSGNLFVSSTDLKGAGSILEFSPTASGDVAPTRTITGTATKLGMLWGIKVDSVGNIYVISTDATGNNPTVVKFAATAAGNVAPTLSFTSTSWTRPDNGFSLAVF